MLELRVGFVAQTRFVATACARLSPTQMWVTFGVILGFPA